MRNNALILEKEKAVMEPQLELHLAWWEVFGHFLLNLLCTVLQVRVTSMQPYLILLTIF